MKTTPNTSYPFATGYSGPSNPTTPSYRAAFDACYGEDAQRRRRQIEREDLPDAISTLAEQADAEPDAAKARALRQERNALENERDRLMRAAQGIPS